MLFTTTVALPLAAAPRRKAAISSPEGTRPVGPPWRYSELAPTGTSNFSLILCPSSSQTDKKAGSISTYCPSAQKVFRDFTLNPPVAVTTYVIPLATGILPSP